MLISTLNLNNNAVIISSLSIILLTSFLLTRVTKKFKLPNVTAYIITGILIGPYVLNIIPKEIINGLDFVTDVALAFIAFGVGKYFKIAVLKQNGAKVFIITIFESLLAAVAVTLVMLFVFHLSVPFSIMLGAIGCATAPASTIMTIRQYGAKGRFVDTILQVTALDDVVSLVAFSICIAVAQALSSNTKLSLSVFLIPILTNVVAILIGIAMGFILNKIINDRRTQDNKLIITISIILAMTGVCSVLDISPLLSSMALGAAYINLSNNSHLFKQINNFTPPILTIFFVLSGMKLDVSSLASAGVIGVVYFVVRIIGKYAGAYLGALVCKSPDEIRNYLGLALIPQAGVSIGLATLGQRILPPEIGGLLSTIILSSSVLYELIGPASAKAALHLSKSIPDDKAKMVSSFSKAEAVSK